MALKIFFINSQPVFHGGDQIFFYPGIWLYFPAGIQNDQVHTILSPAYGRNYQDFVPSVRFPDAPFDQVPLCGFPENTFRNKHGHSYRRKGRVFPRVGGPDKTKTGEHHGSAPEKKSFRFPVVPEAFLFQKPRIHCVNV